MDDNNVVSESVNTSCCVDDTPQLIIAYFSDLFGEDDAQNEDDEDLFGTDEVSTDKGMIMCFFKINQSVLTSQRRKNMDISQISDLIGIRQSSGESIG